ncbi:hypothetical protein ACFPH6_35880 [Streptomyces xiangluensis]|uniref:Uncharacterized protein n=1 Tax=Streptomyces xiangluensis TaxID=2665720 RepID=A0ABV8Z0D6_9ACTN
MAVKVNDWSGAVGSAVFAESGLAVRVAAGERSETVVRTPARYAGFSPAGVTPTPLPGEHNEELLGGR